MLTSSPKVLNLGSLRSDQLKAICGRYRVAIFHREDASQIGLPFASSQSPFAADHAQRLREEMRSSGCAKEHVTGAQPPQS